MKEDHSAYGNHLLDMDCGYMHNTSQQMKFVYDFKMLLCDFMTYVSHLYITNNINKSKQTRFKKNAI